MVGIQGIYNFTTGPGGHKGPKGSQGSQGVTRVPGGHTRVPGGHKGPKGQWGSMGVPRGSQGVPRGPRWLNFLPAARQETLTPELNLWEVSILTLGRKGPERREGPETPETPRGTPGERGPISINFLQNNARA